MVWLLYSMNKVTIKLYEYLTKQYIALQKLYTLLAGEGLSR